MKNKYIIPVLLNLASLALVSFTVQESVLLRLRPRADINYLVKYKESNRHIAQGYDQSSYYESKSSFIVRNTTKSQIEIEAQEESKKMITSNVALASGVTIYDSDNPKFNDSKLAERYNPSLKQPVIISYGELGNSALQDSILRVANTYLCNVFRNVFVSLPKEKISVGSQWSFDMSGFVWTYTVTSISKRHIQVDFVSGCENDNVSIKTEGSATIHPVMGLVTKSNSNTIAIYNQGRENMSIRMIRNSVSVIEK